MEVLGAVLGPASDENGAFRKANVKFPPGVFQIDGAIADRKASTVKVCDSLEAFADQSCEAERVRWMWWQTDAWMETVLDVFQLVSAFLYETLPVFLALPLCLLLEGTCSAANRQLLPNKTNVVGFIFQHVFMCLLAWCILLVWLVIKPDDVKLLDILAPFIVLVWRGVCISLKYAYLSPSDLLYVRSTIGWTRNEHAVRCLGLGKLFNLAGTFEFDVCEALLKSVAYLGIQDEFKSSYFSVSVDIDNPANNSIWTGVKENLEKIALLPDKVRCSKFGDVVANLGLSDIAAIEDKLMDGQLPVNVVAYYFVTKYLRPASKRALPIVMCISLCFGALFPLVSSLTGQQPFGSSVVGRIILGARMFCMTVLSMQPFLFTLYPPIMAMKRARLVEGILATFGHGGALSWQLCRGRCVPRLEIGCMNNLRAFWTLVRVLGPSYDAGYSVRYLSAHVAASAFFLIKFTVVVSRTAGTDLFSFGLLAELCVMYGLGCISIVLAAWFCIRVNGYVPWFGSLVRRALIVHPELGGPGKDIIADISTEHLAINPIQVMFLPAEPGLMSFLLSGLVVLAGLYLSALPFGICLPLLSISVC
eukprot:TRINITY_DN10645_c0_g2_i1.p1 TRINITY_DN10645_c0_g2~~TRINITY_DN10645_c0_g2_i1.p1  ORF type:complete len:590 (+),score=60.24 TRINITY_DN10645_c0_g2_i1:73-1842(+)